VRKSLYCWNTKLDEKPTEAILIGHGRVNRHKKRDLNEHGSCSSHPRAYSLLYEWKQQTILLQSTFNLVARQNPGTTNPKGC
jgi:hypothetical protein